MQAEVQLIVRLESISDKSAFILENKTVEILADNTGGRMLRHSSGDIGISEISRTIDRFLCLFSSLEFLDARAEIWLRIDSETEFAGFSLENDALRALGEAGATLIVSTYAEGKDWGAG